MTIAEMHTLVDLLIDKANAPWFTPAEKDNFLNLAIQEYTKNKHMLFETDEKVREDLLTLVVSPYTVLATDTINLDTIGNFLFALRLEATITNACGTKTGIPVSPRQHDDFASLQRDPFNKASDDYPVYLQFEIGGARSMKVYSTTTPPDALNLTYLRTPAVVSITVPTNCDLPQHTHEEIVNLAVRKMLMTIDGFENYQFQINEINSQE